MTKNRVTIKDVAKLASVGLGTASRAINGSDGVSAATREKVFKAIQDLGYVPDKTAQNMRASRFKKIGFMMDISNIAFSYIAKSIQSELNNLGYELTLCDVGTKDTLKKMKDCVNNNKLDGIIVTIPKENDEEINQFLSNTTLPIVILDREIEICTGLVQTDYFSSVKKATEYLLSLGHEKIALIGVSHKIRPTKVSIEAFKFVLEQQNIPIENSLIVEGSFTIESGEEIMEKLLKKIKRKEITAILSLNSRLFHGILKVIRANSISYPEDVSLITVEDDMLTELLNPPVTVIKRDLAEMGKNSAVLICKLVENQGLLKDETTITIPTEFIIRESCRSLENNCKR